MEEYCRISLVFIVVEEVLLQFDVLLDAAVDAIVVLDHLVLQACDYHVHLGVLLLSALQELLHLPNVGVLVLLSAEGFPE